MTEARMQETPDYAPGTFCWVELATSDSEAGKKFYTELFGWTFVDNPIGPGMVYTMFKQDGKDVGALYQLTPEMNEARIPPNWLSYVSVTNADESSQRAKSLGGKLMKEPFDVFTVGRMSVVQDPTGAVFALWQPGTHNGAGITNVPNTFCWNELGTPDPNKAGDFYSALFGWSKKEQQMGPMTYTTFINGERPAGGMYKPTPEMGNVPPHWLVYFAVREADATIGHALKMGGKLLAPAMDIPDVGRFAVIQDPQGAAFGVIALANSQS